MRQKLGEIGKNSGICVGLSAVCEGFGEGVLELAGAGERSLMSYVGIIRECKV